MPEKPQSEDLDVRPKKRKIIALESDNEESTSEGEERAWKLFEWTEAKGGFWSTACVMEAEGI